MHTHCILPTYMYIYTHIRIHISSHMLLHISLLLLHTYMHTHTFSICIYTHMYIYSCSQHFDKHVYKYIHTLLSQTYIHTCPCKTVSFSTPKSLYRSLYKGLHREVSLGILWRWLRILFWEVYGRKYVPDCRHSGSKARLGGLDLLHCTWALVPLCFHWSDWDWLEAFHIQTHEYACVHIYSTPSTYYILSYTSEPVCNFE